MEKKYYSAGGETTNAMAGFWAHFLRRKGATGYGSASTAEQVAANYDGKGKTIVITGASSGLGAEAARVLAGRGAEVIMAVRDVDKAKRVADGIKARQADAKLVLMELDLADLTSVRKFAADFKATGKPLHVLMCNAGIMACPFTLSKDGHEVSGGEGGRGRRLHHLSRPRRPDTAAPTAPLPLNAPANRCSLRPTTWATSC